MKKTAFAILAIFALFSACNQPPQSANNDEYTVRSRITFPELNDELIENLDFLGKLWGFLKYHHPAIGEGNYNWDHELFRVLPEYLQANNTRQRDEILLKWIKKYGKTPGNKNNKQLSAEIFLEPDFSWIETIDVSAALRKKVKEIYMNRHQGEHFYIDKFQYVGNPDFRNENSYSTISYPDEGFRLLSLYRYWNMIHYFFPYTYMTDKSWNLVLKEYIPLFISTKSRLDYELVVLRLIGEINDSHANLSAGGKNIQKLRGYNFAPFRVEFIEEKLIVTDSYNQDLQAMTGLSRADIITHINGKTIESIVDSLRPYYPASNEVVRLRDLSRDLLRSTSKSLNIEYISSRQIKNKEISLYSTKDLDMYPTRNEKCYKFIDKNIGYVTLANIEEKDVPAIKEEFKNTKGIIIDIRNYPSTFVPFSLGSYFVSSLTPFVKFTIGNGNNPGEFYFTPQLEISPSGDTYQGKLVVLVNERTQSQAEYTAMAFRAGDNTTIIGSTTAAADGNVSTIALPGGIETTISGIGVYYPDGTETQRIGIVPDIVVNRTIEGVRKGKDELLEKAIQLINSE